MHNAAITEVVTDRAARGVVSNTAETVSLAGDTGRSGVHRAPPQGRVHDRGGRRAGGDQPLGHGRADGNCTRAGAGQGCLAGTVPGWPTGHRGRPLVLGRATRPAPETSSCRTSSLGRTTPYRWWWPSVDPRREMVARQVATLFSLVKPVAPAGSPLCIRSTSLVAAGRLWNAILSVDFRPTPPCGGISRAEAVRCRRRGVRRPRGRRTGSEFSTSEVPASKPPCGGNPPPPAGDIVSMRVDRGNAGHAVDDSLLAALCQGSGLGRSEGRPPVDRLNCVGGAMRAKVSLSRRDGRGRRCRRARSRVRDGPAAMSRS
jgi:hypothetical protein